MNHIFNRRSSWCMCKINRQSSLQNKDNYVCFIFKSVTKCTRNCAIANRSSSASYNSIKNTNEDNYVCFIFKSVTKCTRNCAIANRSSSASYNSIKNKNEDDKCILNIHAARMCQKI